MHCRPPGSSVRGILQARILEWVALPFLGDLPNSGTEPASPALQGDSLLLSHQGRSPIVLLLMPHQWPGFCEPETEQWENSLHLSKDDTTGFVMVPIIGRQCSYGHWELRVPGSLGHPPPSAHLESPVGAPRIARQGWRMWPRQTSRWAFP